MALSKKTQDHEEIRRWAEERGGKPAEVKSTENEDEPGILRIMFPGARNANDGNLQEIGWDEFFAKFDENGLELIYQEENAEGQKSNFNKLIYPENESESVRSGSRTKTAGRKTSSSARKPASGSSRATRSSAVKKASGSRNGGAKAGSPKTGAAKSRLGSGTKSTARKSPARSSARSSARSGRSGGRSGRSAA